MCYNAREWFQKTHNEYLETQRELRDRFTKPEMEAVDGEQYAEGNKDTQIQQPDSK